MELNSFLKEYFNQLSCKNICDKNNFNEYNNFKKFIYDHYQLNHIELFNYIKYVKIKIQIIKINDGLLYNKHINDINHIIQEMFTDKNIPDINIKRYLFKIDVFFKLIDDKKISYLKTMNKLRNLLDMNKDYCSRFKIISNIKYKAGNSRKVLLK